MQRAIHSEITHKPKKDRNDSRSKSLVGSNRPARYLANIRQTVRRTDRQTWAPAECSMKKHELPEPVVLGALDLQSSEVRTPEALEGCVKCAGASHSRHALLVSSPVLVFWPLVKVADS